MAGIVGLTELQHTNGTSAATINTSGVISQPTKPMFLAYGSGAVTLPNDTWTKVSYNDEQYDIGGYYDHTTNYRYTPLVAGKYLIVARAYISYGSAATENIRMAIYKNGSDYLEIYVRQNTSNDAIYNASQNQGGEFSGFLVG